MKKFVVEPAGSKLRIDKYIATRFANFSRSALSQLFDLGSVKINHASVKASQKVRVGDIVTVDEKWLTRQPDKLNLAILYEDGDVIVINKPAGILTHAKGALSTEATVASFIRPKLNDQSLKGNRAGIVHRLDRGTSGVVIAAKNQTALKWLQQQFAGRQVKKVYLAIVEGVPQDKEAIIDAPIGRHPSRPQTFKVQAYGKPAKTAYKVLKTFAKKGRSYSLVEFKPQTGRTHQIRVHAAYIGHSIVGDSVYGRSKPPIYLHAKSLELILPSRKSKKFSVEPPSAFQEFMSQ